MKLLLDTPALLWWLGDDPALGARARTAIGLSRNTVYASAASAWEITDLAAQGLVDLAPDDLADLPGLFESAGLAELPVTVDHAARLAALPPHHGDPFDRVLIAQAAAEGLTVVTAEPVFAAYGIAVMAAR